MPIRTRIACAVLCAIPAFALAAPRKASPEPTPTPKPAVFKGLEFRNIGPALTSGRISDVAIDPTDARRWFVAVASGGVWRTENAGTTWTPVFDGEGSYSIGCVAIDPHNPATIWVGTGENNSQRSVGYGDGVYRSRDGGESWENLGLKESEHIAKILVDPRDPNVVFVAAQGPLWRSGGDRGVYKTTDGGANWKKVLEISDNTGVTDLVVDPRDPDVLIAAAYQRRRHVWTLIDGGPESAIYKSTDAGATWRKVSSGLPEVDLGRIGLAISPADPDVVYAIVEAADGKGGLFRSRDLGERWEKRSKYVAGSPQYYQELIADPADVDRLYSLDTFLQVSEDGGKSFRRLGNRSRHVDDHALWIDPSDTRHLLVGGDGGLYETFDRGSNWRYFENLPITQFYRVGIDNAAPFYNVYGGTQDNNTIGGPSRTRNAPGIASADWFITQGGDGFWAAVDPEDPNIVYSEAQHGALVRFDRSSGEATGIQPQAAPGEPPLRWNWDSPLIISPHKHTRLYFAAQRVFRSEDRGDSWTPISPDLSRQLDRNALPVMGKVWGPDAVAKNASTSLYGNIVALDESPLREGLLYAGTDDGLIQVLEAGQWRKVATLPGVPEQSYVSDLAASLHDAATVYAAFDNHKAGDFKPYLARSADAGRTWTSIAGDLPERGTVYTVVEDHVMPGLLFAGTEFGVFVTRDGGGHWEQLKGGLPTIAVRDMAIQRRENDLVLATFGRGFYVLDDYSPLRAADPATLAAEAALFAPRQALLYVPARPFGDRDKGSQGETYFLAPNPPFGAVFTYHLKDAVKTRKERRQEAEKEAAKAGKTLPYPSNDELRREALEPDPELLVEVSDDQGRVVRRLTAPKGKGFHRIAWDLRDPSSEPFEPEPPERDPWDEPPAGPLVHPGRYQARLVLRAEGKEKHLAEPQAFDVVPLAFASLPAADRAELVAFQRKAARLQRAVLGAREAADAARERLDLIRGVLLDTPAARPELRERADALVARLEQILIALRGDRALARRNEGTEPSIVERAQSIVYDGWNSTSAPTATQREAYQHAAAAFETELARLRTLIETDLARLDADLERAGAAWTPGRVPVWQKE